MFNKNKTKDFTSLCHSLKFQFDFAPTGFLIGNHLSFVQQKLNTYLNEVVILNPPIREVLNKLQPESYFRLLSSPYFCELLMIAETMSDSELVLFNQQIFSALVAEAKRIDPEFKHTLNPKWTIDGDFILDSKISVLAPTVRTACGININYQSAVHNTGKAGIGGYDYVTALKHKERIETAKNLISIASPSALSMIELFTTNIQFRQNTLKPNVINSSTHTSIGLIRCDNFHKIHSDLPEIVDMLVHETIHQYLHLFEEQVYEFIDTSKFPNELKDLKLFNSPWSGNLLDFRSYTHAILVWYGLVHFWNQYLRNNIHHPEISRQQAQEKLQEAMFGFLNTKSVLDNFKEHKIYLSAEYTLEIERIQKELKYKVELDNANTLL